MYVGTHSGLKMEYVCMYIGSTHLQLVFNARWHQTFKHQGWDCVHLLLDIKEVFDDVKHFCLTSNTFPWCQTHFYWLCFKRLRNAYAESARNVKKTKINQKSVWHQARVFDVKHFAWHLDFSGPWHQGKCLMPNTFPWCQTVFDIKHFSLTSS